MENAPVGPATPLKVAPAGRVVIVMGPKGTPVPVTEIAPLVAILNCWFAVGVVMIGGGGATKSVVADRVADPTLPAVSDTDALTVSVAPFGREVTLIGVD